MDELEISGRRYISSARAAKEHKYHSDYIGQLVRGGKVAGQKVGRAWYVDADSLSQYLGKEVPARGPMKKLNEEDGSEIAEEVISQIPEVVTKVESVGFVEKLVAEPAEVRDFSADLPEQEINTDFIMPVRKSGRHHTIAAIDSKPQIKTPVVEYKQPEPKYQAPVVKEVVAEVEEPFMQAFNSEAEEKTQTFIPLKITKDIPEAEDSFYKVSPRSLKYVSEPAPLPALSKNVKTTAEYIKDVPEYAPVAQRKIQQKQQTKFPLVKFAGMLVVAAALSLGAGVVASYYLHSMTTIGNEGQTSSIIVSQ